MGDIQQGFDVPGEYNLAYYVKNTDGIISSPIVESVIQYLCGDANNDSKVNITDALAVARQVAGLPPPPSINTIAADTDKNGQITIADALNIAQRAVGLILSGNCLN